MTETNAFSQRELEAIRHIRNWVAHNGHTPTIRELMTKMGYKSPRSAQDLLEQLQAKGIVRKSGRSYKLVSNPDFGPVHAQTVNVPVVGTIPAGSPILAEENVEGFVSISTSIAKAGSNYFLLHVVGDSMNEAGIDEGDLVLIRQQPTAEEGQKVVALIDGEATVKEFHRGKGFVILKPRSRNETNKPIIVGGDFQIQGVVVATIPKLE